MTGTKLLLLAIFAALTLGCGAPADTGGEQDPKKPDQSQVDAVKAEGGVPN